jgi:predicted HTH transcriptional regulator
MTHFIKKLIAEGEHQQLDFKFEISDSKKIARTMSAFANTDGGRLLVGVKDNGSIAGVRSEEELYMAEGASNLHCKPEVPIVVKEWEVDGRMVLEIVIASSPDRPHFARDPHDRWRAYVRQGAENYVANRVLLQVWRRKKVTSGTIIRYREQERILMNYLQQHEHISLTRFQKIAGIPKKKAEVILINFIMLGFIGLRYEGNHVSYFLSGQGGY